MDGPVLADSKNLFTSALYGCSFDDLPGVIDKKDGWRERERERGREREEWEIEKERERKSESRVEWVRNCDARRKKRGC